MTIRADAPNLQWIKIVSTTDIPPGSGRALAVGSKGVAVFNVDGQFWAIDNACPHQGGPLGQGRLDCDVVTCPWHSWSFNVKTGCPVLTPNVGTFQVRVNGDAVEIAVPREQLEGFAAVGASEAIDATHQLLERINRSRTLDEVVESIHSGLQTLVPHNRLGIALLDESSGKLVQVKTKSDRKILLDDGFAAQIAGSSLELVFKSGQARIVDDLKENLARRSSTWTRLLVEEGMRSSLTLPLKVTGKPIGVVFFTSATPRAFSETHVGFLKQIAGHLSILIEKGKWTSDLAQSNERYRILFEMSHEGIFICPSVTQSFVTINENLCNWLGYTREDLSKLSLRDLMGPAELQRADEMIAEPTAALETKLLKRDGGSLPVELRITAIEHRGQCFLQGFCRDLSEVQALSAQLRRDYSFENLIGRNHKLQETFELIRQVAPLSTTVLIHGESGTGKELVARAIHQNSPRRHKPFVAVNCGALAEGLLESELFGHVRGAFTGATSTRQGRFEAAHGGTIFLDEVGDSSLSTQVKLLRVLQEEEIEKVGSTTKQKIDVRVIAATNRDLKAAIRTGTFREDLYYRLHVVPIVLPPLRERRDDIPLLVQHFIEKFNCQMQRSVRRVSAEAQAVLMDHSYLGNVRELENIIEHAFVKCAGHIIEEKHLPRELRAPAHDVIALALKADNPLLTLERELVSRMLAECGGEAQLAAQRLGISRTTLWRKLRPPVVR